MAEKLYYDGKEIGEDAIIEFTGSNYYLSNFYTSDMQFNDIDYKCSEAAFQAQKTTDKSIQRKFSNLSPNIAKSLGRRVELRKDWEDIKDDVMYNIIKAKFDYNNKLKEKLLDTGNKELYEGNTWGDKYWGVVKEGNELVGKNHLGRLLMKLREEYKNK